ncbi:MAG: pyruvate ferredoxin oxidoreductase [Firmicutes bacterium]|nr:pyruvate ferredoxin oxidoreductase [Bacillota bacterium]
MALPDLARKPQRFTGGHRACAGCGFPITIKIILQAAENPVVVGCATGCMEVTSTIYPYTAWRCSFIHTAFENAAATISGVEAAYRSLRRQGRVQQDITFIAFGGDGGTYDIGLQSLSGAMERGHKMVYVCYDNQAYMNTGIQRSSATPRGANTTTSPAGTHLAGKQQYPKDLTAIIAAHNIPYVAQSSMSHWHDLYSKAKKAFAADGPAFLNVLSTCRLGWATAPEDTVDIAEGAVLCNFWPLFEVEKGVWKLSFRPKQALSVADWMGKQGRFKHLFRPENTALLADIQQEVDQRWAALLRRCGEKEKRD